MSNKPLKAGGEVDSWCTKCLLVLNHRIVAVMHGKPVKVECLTCRNTHMYRAQPPGTKTPASPKAAKGGGSSAAATPRAPRGIAASRAEHLRQGQELTWQRAIAGKAVGDFKVYRVSGTFGEGDLVRHAKFGDGVVVRVVDAHKIEVLFQDNTRTLAQALTD